MARYDDLPADRKAVLQLVLRQGRTYDEIAGMLKISPETVRERALNALDELTGDDAPELAPDVQDDVGDYLLGQQSASRRAATRAELERSQEARDWARVVSGELRASGLATDESLPEIPVEPAEVGEAFDALHARRRARAEQQRSSRLGGVLLLGALALALAVGIAALLGAFSGGDDSGGSASATTATQGTQTTTGTQVEAQINLTPPSGSSSTALGVANIVSQDGKRALAVVGQDLPAGSHYVLWLRNGSTTKFLGFFPPVQGSGKDKGRLQGLVLAPSDLSRYRELLVSREQSSKPSEPTTVVLQGSLKG
ncbi:MAG TPA: sigma factor-like helix-turn-helix DNA-binding protein [Baekduia sp.]|nr:sigma factor-like helix-turn-helix DNA-binding protein [Baekduia sp.]